MKNKILLITIIFGIMILSTINVMAFMPKFTHKWIFDEAIKEPVNSDFYTSCIKYPDLCYAGNVLVDVSVIYYYTGRDLYSATHSPVFAKSLLENSAKIPGKDIEKMRACAIGGATHQPADIVSHSRIGGLNGRDGLVSYSIKHSLLVNEIIHVFSEQKVDNYVEEKYGVSVGQESEDYLASYKECQDLFILTMLGDNAYQQTGLTRADLEEVFQDFIWEVVNSQQVGYNPAFKEKSFLGTLNSLPTFLLGGYVLVLLIFLTLSVLLIIKMIKKDFRIRNFIGLLIFLPIFIILAYLFIGAVQGKAFDYFVGVIKPISDIVPTGNIQSYLDAAVANTKQLFQNNEQWLEGTDASGRASFPVLDEANASVITYDYIILIALALVFIWFIYYLFKRNKLEVKEAFTL